MILTVKDMQYVALWIWFSSVERNLIYDTKFAYIFSIFKTIPHDKS